MKNDHAAWIAGGDFKSTCNDFNNVKNLPLLKTDSDDTLVMELAPTPALHIILGISNHLWIAKEEIIGGHRRVLQEFTIRHNCIGSRTGQRHLRATNVSN